MLSSVLQRWRKWSSSSLVATRGSPIGFPGGSPTFWRSEWPGVSRRCSICGVPAPPRPSRNPCGRGTRSAWSVFP